MVLDIITAALIVIPMGIGLARGFLYVILRVLGWAGAIAAAVFAAPVVQGFLSGTFVGETIREHLTEQLEEPAEALTNGTDQILGIQAPGVNELLDGFPLVLSHMVEDKVEDTVEAVVAVMEDVILSVASFLLVVIAVRLLLIFVIRPISRMQGKNPVSFLNKLLGLILGGLEGLMLAFLFLAALIPVMHMCSPETAASITDALQYSYLAGPLYDGNLLLAMFG